MLFLTGEAWTRDRELAQTDSESALQAAVNADAALFEMVAFQAVVMLPIFALFVSWLWRIHGQIATVYRSRISWSQGWTIGGWLIPIAFLFVPYLVVRQLVEAATPDQAATARWWWTAFLSMVLLGQLPGAALDADLYGLAYAIVVLQVAAGCAAAGLAIKLIRELTAAQLRFSHFGSSRIQKTWTF